MWPALGLHEHLYFCFGFSIWAFTTVQSCLLWWKSHRRAWTQLDVFPSPSLAWALWGSTHVGLTVLLGPKCTKFMPVCSFHRKGCLLISEERKRQWTDSSICSECLETSVLWKVKKGMGKDRKKKCANWPLRSLLLSTITKRKLLRMNQKFISFFTRLTLKSIPLADLEFCLTVFEGK